MSGDTSDPKLDSAVDCHRDLGEQISRSLKAVQSTRAWYNLLDWGLALGAIIFGGLATALAGGAGFNVESLRQAMGSWRLVCFAAAGSAFLAAVCAGASKGLRIPEKLAKALECKGKLSSMAVGIEVKNRAHVKKTYQKILQTYTEVLP
jgi:hypothetical protein